MKGCGQSGTLRNNMNVTFNHNFSTPYCTSLQQLLSSFAAPTTTTTDANGFEGLGQNGQTYVGIAIALAVLLFLVVCCGFICAYANKCKRKPKTDTFTNLTDKPSTKISVINVENVTRGFVLEDIIEEDEEEVQEEEEEWDLGDSDLSQIVCEK